MQPTSTTSKTSSSPSTKKEAPQPIYSNLSTIKPDKVQELCNLLRNREVWGQLQLLLGTVRQDHLESLVDPSSSPESLVGPRAVILFIDDFLGVIRENLLSAEEDRKRKADPKSDAHTDSNEYMEMSPDWDAPDDLLTQ